MKLFIYLLYIFLPVQSSYIYNYPLNIYKKKYNNKIIKIYESENINNNSKECLLFFTGANSE